MLGSTWLIWKLDGGVQAHARYVAFRAAIATIVLMGAVSLYNITLNPEYAAHWLSAPEVYWVAPVPIVTALVAIALIRTIRGTGESAPFWLALSLFFLGMSGLGVTIWPYVVPPGLTIWDAAAPERSQVFMLVGVAITMPLIICLLYTSDAADE